MICNNFMVATQRGTLIVSQSWHDSASVSPEFFLQNSTLWHLSIFPLFPCFSSVFSVKAAWIFIRVNTWETWFIFSHLLSSLSFSSPPILFTPRCSSHTVSSSWIPWNHSFISTSSVACLEVFLLVPSFTI